MSSSLHKTPNESRKKRTDNINIQGNLDFREKWHLLKDNQQNVLPPMIVEPAPTSNNPLGNMIVQTAPNSPIGSSANSPIGSPPKRNNTIAMLLNLPSDSYPTKINQQNFSTCSTPPSPTWNQSESDGSEEETEGSIKNINEGKKEKGKSGGDEDDEVRTGRKRSKSQVKRQRRTASEIRRLYLCQIPHCNKSYGSEAALKMHVKLKHQHTSHFYQQQFQHHIALARQKQIQQNYRTLQNNNILIPSPSSNSSSSSSSVLSPSASPPSSPPLSSAHLFSSFGGGVDQRQPHPNMMQYYFHSVPQQQNLNHLFQPKSSTQQPFSLNGYPSSSFGSSQPLLSPNSSFEISFKQHLFPSSSSSPFSKKTMY